MSTLAEIEAAIETLPPAQIEELTDRLNQRKFTTLGQPGSAESSTRPDAQDGSVEKFFGSFNSGNPDSANNDRIDADLAREHGRGL